MAPLLEDPDGNLYCPLLNEFETLLVGYGKSVAGIYEVFKRIEKPGPIGLGVKLFHSADKKLKVYEFVKGDLRVFCFLAPHGPVCVCCTVRLKKGQSADKGAVRITAEFAKNYRAAYDNGLIQFFTADKEGNLIRENT